MQHLFVIVKAKDEKKEPETVRVATGSIKGGQIEIKVAPGQLGGKN